VRAALGGGSPGVGSLPPVDASPSSSIAPPLAAPAPSPSLSTLKGSVEPARPSAVLQRHACKSMSTPSPCACSSIARACAACPLRSSSFRCSTAMRSCSNSTCCPPPPSPLRAAVPLAGGAAGVTANGSMVPDRPSAVRHVRACKSIPRPACFCTSSMMLAACSPLPARESFSTYSTTSRTCFSSSTGAPPCCCCCCCCELGAGSSAAGGGAVASLSMLNGSVEPARPSAALQRRAAVSMVTPSMKWTWPSTSSEASRYCSTCARSCSSDSARDLASNGLADSSSSSSRAVAPSPSAPETRYRSTDLTSLLASATARRTAASASSRLANDGKGE